MPAVQEDAVNHPLHAHLALVLLLLDGVLLHLPPSSDPVLESNATYGEETLDLLVGQPHHLTLSDRGNREHLQDLLPTDRTLCQFLSTLVAGDEVAAVKDDTVNVGVHAHLAFGRLVLVSKFMLMLA